MPTPQYTIGDAPPDASSTLPPAQPTSQYTVGDAPPTTSAAPGQGGLGGWLEMGAVIDPQISGPSGEFVKGGIKEGGRGLGNAINDYFNPKPLPQLRPDNWQLPSNMQATAPNAMQQAVHQHVADAVNWLTTNSEPQGFWQGMGALGEQIGEIITADNALKLAGPINKGVDAIEHMKQGQQLLQAFRNSPSLRAIVGIGLKHTKDALALAPIEATKMAGQTLIHTNDPEQAKKAGIMAGVLTPVIAGATPLVSEGVSRAGSAMMRRFGPKTVAIGSEAAVPVEARQLGEQGEILATGTETANTARAQQEAFDRDLQVHSRQALRTSLQNLNDAIGPPQRPMLPPPSGADMPVFHLTGPPTETPATSEFQQRPGVFQRQGTATTERNIGDLTHPAHPLPRTSAPASYGSPTPPEPGQPSAWQRTPQGDRPIPATMHPGRELPATQELAPGEQLVQAGTPSDIPPETREPVTWDNVLNGEPQRTNYRGPGQETVVGGGGVSGQTPNPAEAVGYRNEYRRIMESPEFRELPPEQQAQIRGYHDWLTQELGTYYSQPHGGIIPADIASATQHVVSPGDAADLIKAQVAPGYEELNKLTNGKINLLNEDVSQAKATLRDPKSGAADRQAARQTIARNEEEITGLIERHAGDTNITRQYYNAMKKSSVDAGLLEKVDNVIESWAGGISRQNTANSTNLTRVVKANVQDFEDILKDGNNREMFARLMGPHAEETIKTWGQLLADPATARKTSGVLENTAREMGRLKWQLGTTGVTVAALMGTGMGTGTKIAAGITGATWLARGVMRRAAMNGNVTRLIRYAVYNNVDSRIYAPLIARTLTQLYNPPQQVQPQQTEQKKQPQP
jgi:hypothetical protein